MRLSYLILEADPGDDSRARSFIRPSMAHGGQDAVLLIFGVGLLGLAVLIAIPPVHTDGGGRRDAPLEKEFGGVGWGLVDVPGEGCEEYESKEIRLRVGSEWTGSSGGRTMGHSARMDTTSASAAFKTYLLQSPP